MKNKLVLIFCFLLVNSTIAYAQSVYDEGYHEYLNGDLNKAIQLFNYSISKQEQVANSFLYRSAAQIFLGKYEEAELGLDTVKKINQSTPKLNYYYGKLYLIWGQFQNLYFF